MCVCVLARLDGAIVSRCARGPPADQPTDGDRERWAPSARNRVRVTLFGTVTGSANDLSKSFAGAGSALVTLGNYEAAKSYCGLFAVEENPSKWFRCPTRQTARTINGCLKHVTVTNLQL
ncbi:hypothetical protein Trydic_g9124 [Trypoxylus dichotomus]